MNPMQQHLGDLIGSDRPVHDHGQLEAGMQNWTDQMISEFQQAVAATIPRRIFRCWLGAWWRMRTSATASCGTFAAPSPICTPATFTAPWTANCIKLGMKAYSEASGVALEIPEDTLLNKSHIDIPMAEFLVGRMHPESMYYADVRGAASTAHVYGSRWSLSRELQQAADTKRLTL